MKLKLTTSIVFFLNPLFSQFDTDEGEFKQIPKSLFIKIIAGTIFLNFGHFASLRTLMDYFETIKSNTI